MTDEQPVLKRFTIVREIPPGLTWAEVDASAIQNIVSMTATDVEPEVAWTPGLQGVRWIRSYWEQGNSWGLCLYQGTGVRQVEDWNIHCRVPFVEVREVDEQVAPIPPEYHSGFHADTGASHLVALEGPAGEGPDDLFAAAGLESPTWIRNYVDHDRGRAVALYRAALPSREAVRLFEERGWTVRRVVEITPGDYVDIE